MSFPFTATDTGKPVVTTDGTVIGRVQEIRTGDAYVRPKEGLLEACGFWLANSIRSDDAFPLDQQRVESIEADRIVVTSEESKLKRRIP